jgi:hypothetical protein
VIARADAALYSERRKLEHRRPEFRRSDGF